jgi:hypothetical protein
MDRDDLELFERSLANATEQHTGDDLDAALADLGWGDALADDPRAAIPLLFELQGAANVTSSALDAVVLDALGVDDTSLGVVLPAVGSCVAPAGLAGQRLTISGGVGTAALATRVQVLVVARTNGDGIFVTLPAADLDLRPVAGLDPSLGLIEVRSGTIEIREKPRAAEGWTSAVALAQLAVGHELVGASRRMLELAREHALERVQFGQPISMFQAIRHRLADTLVAIETADAVLDAAWLDRTPETASMAKALAGRGARLASRHCQQVLAGIGFTTEHTLHRYIRRVLVLDELFGSARSLTRQLGDDLLATRELPAQLPL